MAFTTWAALLITMRDDLANGTWKVSSYSVPGRSTTYTDVEKFMEVMDYVEIRAQQDAGTYIHRTYAKNGGSN